MYQHVAAVCDANLAPGGKHLCVKLVRICDGNLFVRIIDFLGEPLNPAMVFAVWLVDVEREWPFAILAVLQFVRVCVGLIPVPFRESAEYMYY